MKTRNDLNPNDILVNVQIILQQIQDFPQILNKLSNNDQNKFYDLLGQLQQQFSSHKDKPEELLSAANTFLTEIENKKEFRQVFLSEKITEVELQSLQEDRQRSINQYSLQKITDELDLRPMDPILNSITTIFEFRLSQEEHKEKMNGRQDEEPTDH